MNVATPVRSFDFTEIERITGADLAGMAKAIDDDRVYPEDIIRAYGAAGAYGTHLAGPGGHADLTEAIMATTSASRSCLSTGFCMWCQQALGWYIASSDSAALKSEVLPGVATGAILGGTGLSNPMKAVAEIEPLRLKGTPVEGGYSVKGVLPWVSNLSEDGWFGIVFSVGEGAEAKTVMAIAHADEAKGVKLKLDHEFMAMGGTATCQVQFRDAFIPKSQVVGDPAPEFIRRIRGGFVLLQCGMALGMVQSSIALMEQVEGSLGHVNKYLDKQPADFQAAYDVLEAEILDLAKTPYDPSPAYWKRVLEVRLAGGEAAVEAAHYAMLHCGARGYVSNGAAQRRLREAYFVAIVTPATKHLRKMLAEMAD